MTKAKHTPGPWYVDTVRNEGEYGNNGPDTRSGFNSFAIFDTEGRVLFDSLNRDGSACEVTEDYDEDGGSAWDAQAKADAERIVQCVNKYDELSDIVSKLASLADGLINGNSAAEEAASDLAERARTAIAKAEGQS